MQNPREKLGVQQGAPSGALPLRSLRSHPDSQMKMARAENIPESTEEAVGCLSESVPNQKDTQSTPPPSWLQPRETWLSWLQQKRAPAPPPHQTHRVLFPSPQPRSTILLLDCLKAETLDRHKCLFLSAKKSLGLCIIGSVAGEGGEHGASRLASHTSQGRAGCRDGADEGRPASPADSW